MNVLLTLLIIIPPLISPPPPKPIGTTDSRFPITEPAKSFYNSITPESQMKMQYLMPCPPMWLRAENADIAEFGGTPRCVDTVYNFAEADARVAWAKDNNYSIWGHTILWAQQTPEWMSVPLPKEWKQRILYDYAYVVSYHFCDQVAGWDVANEVLSSGLGVWADLDDAVQTALDGVRKGLKTCGGADKVLLAFNEGSYCYDNPEFTDKFIRFGRIYNPDVLAAQCHLGLGTPKPLSVATIIAEVTKINRSGFTARMSEVDGLIYGMATRDTQYKTFKNISIACHLTVCQGITFWGNDDKTSWLTWIYPGPIDALPIDYNYALKPNMESIKLPMNMGKVYLGVVNK